jgi:hypothetical protein
MYQRVDAEVRTRSDDESERFVADAIPVDDGPRLLAMSFAPGSIRRHFMTTTSFRLLGGYAMLPFLS